MKIKDTLKHIVHAYDCLRQAGHTWAMVQGAKNIDRVTVVTMNYHQGEDLRKTFFHKNNKANIIPIKSFNERIRGTNAPIVFDNAAIWQICKDAVDEIESIENKLSEKTTEVHSLEKQLRQAKSALKEMSDYADNLMQHKDMSCLPMDLELLRDSNLALAKENHYLHQKCNEYEQRLYTRKH